MNKDAQKSIENTRKELVKLAAESNSLMIYRLIKNLDNLTK